jgi:hypothetical protein
MKGRSFLASFYAAQRVLFLATKIWRHAGKVGISYSDHYAEENLSPTDGSFTVDQPGGPRFGRSCRRR